jgi:hypothetical protein
VKHGAQRAAHSYSTCHAALVLSWRNHNHIAQTAGNGNQCLDASVVQAIVVADQYQRSVGSFHESLYFSANLRIYHHISKCTVLSQPLAKRLFDLRPAINFLKTHSL